MALWRPAPHIACVRAAYAPAYQAHHKQYYTSVRLFLTIWKLPETPLNFGTGRTDVFEQRKGIGPGGLPGILVRTL